MALPTAVLDYADPDLRPVRLEDLGRRSSMHVGGLTYFVPERYARAYRADVLIADRVELRKTVRLEDEGPRWVFFVPEGTRFTGYDRLEGRLEVTGIRVVDERGLLLEPENVFTANGTR